MTRGEYAMTRVDDSMTGYGMGFAGDFEPPGLPVGW